MYVLIVRNNSNPEATDASLLLSTYFADQSIDFDVIDALKATSPGAAELVASKHDERIDLAVVLGGDGTILRVARLLRGLSVPILGINFGSLGFLANSGDDGVVKMVASALAGDMVCERRANLHIDVVCEGEFDPFEDIEGAPDAGDFACAADDVELGYCEESAEDSMHPRIVGPEIPSFGVNTDGLGGVRSFFALNEIAITRGALGRIIDFSLNIDDHHIADMRGDGIVVATATGSTAYALSSGGPLVAPEFMGLITVPLSPHTLHARSIITSDNDVVCITLTSTDINREATLFTDGDLLVFDKPVERIYVRRGAEPTLLLRGQDGDFYDCAARTFFSRE